MSRIVPLWLSIVHFLVCAGTVLGQSNELSELQGVTLVVEELDQKEKTLGLGEAWLKEHALELLRSKVPRLTVGRSSAEGSILVDATFAIVEQEDKATRYYGVLELDVFRVVAIKKTQQLVWAPVWGEQYILTGLTPHAPTQVRETLSLLIADFAVKWNHDNPLENSKGEK